MTHAFGLCLTCIVCCVVCECSGRRSDAKWFARAALVFLAADLLISTLF